MKKKYTKKQIIVISVAIAVILTAIAASITLPLVLIGDKTPDPYIEAFDQKNDMYITIAWEKASNASSYSVQYVFGNVIANEDNIKTVKTEGLFYRIERQKGVLAYRVKAISKNEREYSKWKYFDVTALKLGTTSNITLNNAGVLSWANVKYLDKSTLKTVPSYVVDIKLEGEYFDTFIQTGIKSLDNDINNDIKFYLLNLMSYYDEDTEPWKDITLTVKVKCLNYYDFANMPIDKGYEFLFNAYEESEYYEQVITIDKNKYKTIKG